MDSYNFKRDRGLAGTDRRHVFVSYIYPLSFLRGQRLWYEKALGGRQLSGVTTLQSAARLNVGIQPDQAGIGQGGQRPNVIGDWREADQTARRWFDTAAFALPSVGRFGDVGRSVVIGPGTNNWDVSVQKEFRIGERATAEFRPEFQRSAPFLLLRRERHLRGVQLRPGHQCQ